MRVLHLVLLDFASLHHFHVVLDHIHKPSLGPSSTSPTRSTILLPMCSFVILTYPLHLNIPSLSTHAEDV